MLVRPSRLPQTGRCRVRHHFDHTPATQALPGGSRSQPVIAGSLNRKVPAVPVIPGRSGL